MDLEVNVILRLLCSSLTSLYSRDITTKRIKWKVKFSNQWRGKMSSKTKMIPFNRHETRNEGAWER